MYKLRGFICMAFFSINAMQAYAQDAKILRAGLSDLFQLADENNRELKILENNEKIAAAAIKQEQQKLLPSLDASLAVSYNGDGWITDRNFSNGFKADIPAFGNNFALEAKQIIYAGGAIKTSIEMAKRNQSLSLLNKEKNRQNIRFGITGHYLEILKLQNQQQIIEKNISQTNKMIEQIQAKKQEGAALKNDITRFELQLQSLNLSALRLKNSVTIMNNELVKTLQLPVGTILELKDEDNPMLAMGVPASEGYSWKSIADVNSPVLKEAELQIEQARSAEKLVRSEKLPQIFGFASNHLNGPVMIEIPVLNNNFNYWYVGAGIKYNIASLYKNKAKADMAHLSMQNSVESKNVITDQLDNEIVAANIRYHETLDVYQTQLKSVALAQQNYTIIKNRYTNDLVLITEMLDAENAKLDAELRATNAQINILFHHYQLKKLSGTL